MRRLETVRTNQAAGLRRPAGMAIEALERRAMLAGAAQQQVASFLNRNSSPIVAHAGSISSPSPAAESLYQATQNKTPTTKPNATVLIGRSKSAAIGSKKGRVARTPVKLSSASPSTKKSGAGSLGNSPGGSLQTLTGGVASPAVTRGPPAATQLVTGFEPSPDATDVPQVSYSIGNLVGQNGWTAESGESESSTAVVESNTVDSGTQAVQLNSEGSGSQVYADFNTTESSLTTSQISAGGGVVDINFAMMVPVLTTGQTRSVGFGVDIFSVNRDQVIASLYDVHNPAGLPSLEVTNGGNTAGTPVGGAAGIAPPDGDWGTYHMQMNFNNDTFTVFVDGNANISGSFKLNGRALPEGGIGAVELATTADGNDSAYFDNLSEAITTPAANQIVTAFNGLTAPQSIPYGAPTATFGGTISGSGVFPPSTESVAVSLNGTTVNAPINSQGGFSATFDTSQMPASPSPYVVSYVYAGDSDFESVADSQTTTLAINATVPSWLSPTSNATWNSFSQMLTVSGPSTIVADPGGDEPVIQASGAAAQLTIDSASDPLIHIGGLTLTNGASATITSVGSARTANNYRTLVIGISSATVAPTFTIDSTSTLDVTDNDVIDLYGSGTSPYAAIRADITQAYDGGKWDLAGLTSSAAQANHSTYGLGYAEAAALQLSSFDGVALGANAVLVKYTLLGDTTLKGSVGLGDYNTVVGNINSGHDWIGGSFHYDSNVGVGDYNNVLANLNRTMSVSLAISASLSDDTGASSTDAITSDPAMAGRLTDASPVTFLAGFDSASSSSYKSVLSDVQSNGVFTLSPSQLAQINGAPLSDGPHTLYLQQLNATGELILSEAVSFTLDTTAPTSTVAALPAQESSGSFSVNWSGTDGAAGSGIATYNVLVSIDGQPYTNWQQNVTATSAIYAGQPGHSYGFYSIATDNAGNIQPTPTSAQASTTVEGPALPSWLNPTSIATWNPSSQILTVTGAATIVADPGTDEPIIQASGAAAVVTLDPTTGTDIHLGGLSLTNGASATVTPLGSSRSLTNYHLLVIGTPGATVAPAYTIDSTSKLDLADNDMAILYGTGASLLSTVQSELRQAYDNHLWDLPGLTSSIAKTSGGVTSLGYAEASTLGLSTFDGLTLGGNAVVVKYTLTGDANLDGSVNLADFNKVTGNFNGSGDTWTDGSFDYSGNISLVDFNDVLKNFNQSLASVIPGGTGGAN